MVSLTETIKGEVICFPCLSDLRSLKTDNICRPDLGQEPVTSDVGVIPKDMKLQ